MDNLLSALSTISKINAAIADPAAIGLWNEFAASGVVTAVEVGLTAGPTLRDPLKVAVATPDPSPWLSRYASGLAAQLSTVPPGESGVGIGLTTGRFRWYHAAPVAAGGALADWARSNVAALRPAVDRLTSEVGDFRFAGVGLEVGRDRSDRWTAYATVPDPARLAFVLAAPVPDALATLVAVATSPTEGPPLLWVGASDSASQPSTKAYVFLRRRLRPPTFRQVLDCIGDAAAVSRLGDLESLGSPQVVGCSLAPEGVAWTLYFS